jgi:hypothetical protein
MPKKTISREATPRSRPVRRKTGDAVQRSPQGDQWRTWALGLLLTVVVFAVYFPALSHPFVIYDDVDYVSQNRQVQQGLTLGTFRWALTSMQFSNWHPLTWMSHALDCELFGLDAGGHHFTSLLLHAIDAVILFLLLSRMTGKIGRSLMVGALFALHPVNVESVAWVAERKTVLSMLFLLLALWAYLWYVRKPGIGRHSCVDALFALALAAKPMAVTFPFILLLLDYWPLQRIELQRIEDWQSPSETIPLPQVAPLRLLKEKLPLFALSAASCTVTVIAQHRVAMQTMEAFPLRDRVVNALFSYVMYLWKAVWPVHLSVFYAPQGSRLAIWQAVLCHGILNCIQHSGVAGAAVATLFVIRVVVVLGNAGADDWDRSGGRSGNGRSICLPALCGNLHSCRLGPRGPGADNPHRATVEHSGSLCSSPRTVFSDRGGSCNTGRAVWHCSRTPYK